MSYLRNQPSRGATPQSRPLPGQIPNRAGGHVWKIDPLARLRRFLILGAEGGTYYASEREMVFTNIDALNEADPHKAIELIAEVSSGGLAPKNDPALYALAHYATHPDVEVRRAALAMLPVVARIGTHLLHFAAFVDASDGGWGRAKRRAVAEWYAQRLDFVAYQTTKYRQRDNWSHKDLLRLAHPALHVSSDNPTVDVSDAHRLLFDWIAHGADAKGKKNLPDIVRGYRKAMKATTPAETAGLIQQYNLPRECVNPDHLKSPAVWRALLFGGEEAGEVTMPLGALIRNLPTMTRNGTLIPLTRDVEHVCKAITSEANLKGARIHPLNVLTAQLTYAGGRSLRGSSEWEPISQIVDALDEAFYRSFDYVEPTGKRTLIGLDVSGSMHVGQINGVPGLTPRVTAAAMAMVTMRSGDPYLVTAFTSERGGWYGNTIIRPVDLSPRMRLRDVCAAIQGLPFGGTDCALPMLYAIDKGLKVDTFAVYTDNESWAGEIHAAQALERYRRKTAIDARLVAVAFTATHYSIADPNDPLMMDVVGFDSSAPSLISQFAAGKI